MRTTNNTTLATFFAALALVLAAPVIAQTSVPAPVPATSGAVSAAPAAAAAEAPYSTEYGISLSEAWKYGGGIMYLLSLLSVLGLAAVVYLLIVLRPSAVAPRALRLELADKLRIGDTQGARTACEGRPSPLASVVLAGLDFLRNSPRADRDLLKDAMESEGARQAQKIEGGTQWLLDISVVAPMFGLLGTVMGMLKAFGSVAHDVAAAKPVILAQGVSQAIVTTIFGLIVAIPCLIFFAFLRRRANRQISYLEAAVTDVMADLVPREEP